VLPLCFPLAGLLKKFSGSCKTLDACNLVDSPPI